MQLLAKFPKHTKIRLDKDASEEKIYQALFGQNLTGDEEVIILQDLFQSSVAKILEKQTPTKEIIFCQKREVDRRLVAKLPKNIKVEYFKKSLPIYGFLDSLAPKSKIALKLSGNQQDHILWYLQSRVFELILAKIVLNIKDAQIIIGRSLAPWQWKKIKDQSLKFELSQLQAIFQGALKVDYLIKTGKTSLDENTLTSILLLKYLQ